MLDPVLEWLAGGRAAMRQAMHPVLDWTPGSGAAWHDSKLPATAALRVCACAVDQRASHNIPPPVRLHPFPPQVSFGGNETMSMKQLSGGQKTLVALALIFAIQVVGLWAGSLDWREPVHVMK